MLQSLKSTHAAPASAARMNCTAACTHAASRYGLCAAVRWPARGWRQCCGCRSATAVCLLSEALCALMTPCLQAAGVSCVACRLRRELPRARSPMQRAARASVPHRAADRCAAYAELCFHPAACQQATAARPHVSRLWRWQLGGLQETLAQCCVCWCLVSCVARSM